MLKRSLNNAGNVLQRDFIVAPAPLLPLQQALDQLRKTIAPNTETETVTLAEALGRVLAHEVIAPSPLPGFTNSAMDGFAVLANSIEPETPYSILGESLAGHPFEGQIVPGSACRITTGAVLPEGADAVILIENTSVHGNQVTFHQAPIKYEHVRFQGEDIAQGAQVLPAFTRLNAAHLALLASTGANEVEVYRRTRVGLLTTGDEVIKPGTALTAGQLYNSNGPAIQAMLHRLDAEVRDYGIVPDSPEALTEALIKADAECDFVVSTGGVSVGVADFTRDVLAQLGNIDFWKLAIKPGKPLAFGTLPNSYFIGLPGNPVSAIVTFHVVAAAAIRCHQHRSDEAMTVTKAKLSHDIKRSSGRQEFMRAHYHWAGEHFSAELTRTSQGSHQLSTLANANAYLVFDADQGNAKAGDWVTLWKFDDGLMN